MTALRAFATVAEAGGVTRAAGLLHLTQSAVSMQLKRLEEALGRQLLERAGRGVVLTADGEKLLGYARRILALNDEVWSRFTDAAFEGEVAVAPSNASFQDFVTAMRSERGDQATAEWLEGLADNGAQVYANNTAIVEAVGRGEIAYGLLNHYYNHRAREEDPSVPSENHVFPDGDIGSLLIVSAAAIPAASDRTDDAEALLSYLLQEDAQRFYAEETFEYPLARGVAAPEGLPPLDELSVDTVDLDTLGGGLARTRELIEASGLER